MVPLKWGTLNNTRVFNLILYNEFGIKEIEPLILLLFEMVREKRFGIKLRGGIVPDNNGHKVIDKNTSFIEYWITAISPLSCFYYIC